MKAREGVFVTGFEWIKKAEDYFNEAEKAWDIVCPAWAKFLLRCRTGWAFGHPENNTWAMSLARVHARIEAYRPRYEQHGNTLALLYAVKYCAEENVPLPTWLATAYIAALSNFGPSAGSTSLDDVFRDERVPTNTKQKFEAAHRDWEFGCLLSDRAWQIVLDDDSIKSMDILVDRVLQSTPPERATFRQWPVKKTKAKELISWVDNNQVELLNLPKSQKQTLSQFLAKRRKR